MKLIKLNQVVLIIILVQFIFTVGANLSIPFFTVYLLGDIGTAAAAVGFAGAIYWAVKSILQLAVARRIDKNHGEIDDYYSMLLGATLSTVGVFLFFFAKETWHVFAIQALIGIGDAFYVPPFYAIFTRHIDRESEGFEWSLESSFSLGAGSAIGGALSGILVALIGIRSVYLINGIMMVIGLITLFFLRPYIRPKATTPVERVFIEQKRI